jgi:hypothetical protein
MEYKIGQKVKCIKVGTLTGNDVAPPLKENELYVIKNIINDRKGNQHLDVGIESKYTFIRSWETKENLVDGDKIHWCHPSRFELSE